MPTEENSATNGTRPAAETTGATTSAPQRRATTRRRATPVVRGPSQTAVVPAGAQAPIGDTAQPPATSRQPARSRTPRARTGAASGAAPQEVAGPAVQDEAPTTADALPATARAVHRAHHNGAISPTNTVFVSLCFEGPDVYSMAGGL